MIRAPGACAKFNEVIPCYKKLKKNPCGVINSHYNA